jgi:hypothetical protein
MVVERISDGRLRRRGGGREDMGLWRKGRRD